MGNCLLGIEFQFCKIESSGDCWTTMWTDLRLLNCILSNGQDDKFYVTVWRSEVAQSCETLRSHGLLPTRLLHLWNFPGKSTGVGCHFLLQGIFPTRGLNPGLPHCRQTLYHLSLQGSPSVIWGQLTSQSFSLLLCEMKLTSVLECWSSDKIRKYIQVYPVMTCTQ